MSLNEQAQEYFVYVVLGIVPINMFDETKYKNYLFKEYQYETDVLSYDTYCAFMCAIRAYLDFPRTIHYNKGNDNFEKLKKNFKNDVYKYLAENAMNKESNQLIKGVYDISKHEKYKNLFEKENPFSYGQAQKWANMTAKYLNFIGKRRQRNTYNIPIDRYIIDALWNIKEINLPLKEGADRNKDYTHPRDYVSPAWSEWGQEQYSNEFLTQVNDYCKPNSIKWEHKAWIEQSEKEKGVK